jgi:hypothetical protein
MELWSVAYSEEQGPVSEIPWYLAAGVSSSACYVSLSKWREIDAEEPDAKRIFCEISYEGKKIYCPLATPLSRCENDAALYVSYEVLEKLGVDGVGEPVEVRWLSQEAFPEATRIVLRPHDSAFYHADAKEELERELTRLGVIQEGETIMIRLEALGGFELAVDVVKTEPATLVLAEGEEVAVEFEEAWDAAAGTGAAGTGAAEVPEEIPVATPDFGQMLPEAPQAQPQGQRLGGRAINPWRDPNYMPKATV